MFVDHLEESVETQKLPFNTSCNYGSVVGTCSPRKEWTHDLENQRNDKCANQSFLLYFSYLTKHSCAVRYVLRILQSNFYALSSFLSVKIVRFRLHSEIVRSSHLTSCTTCTYRFEIVLQTGNSFYYNVLQLLQLRIRYCLNYH